MDDFELDIIDKKIDNLIQEVSNLKHLMRIIGTPIPIKIPFSDFCREYGISRPTGYAWADRGLIKTEMVGGRRYVIESSIRTSKKYQRAKTDQEELPPIPKYKNG